MSWVIWNLCNYTAHGADVRPQGVLRFTQHSLNAFKRRSLWWFSWGWLFSWSIRNRWAFFFHGYISIRIPQAVSRKCQGKYILAALFLPFPVTPISGKSKGLCDIRLDSSHHCLYLSLSSQWFLQQAEKNWKFQTEVIWFPLDIYS